MKPPLTPGQRAELDEYWAGSASAQLVHKPVADSPETLAALRRHPAGTAVTWTGYLGIRTNGRVEAPCSIAQRPGTLLVRTFGDGVTNLGELRHAPVDTLDELVWLATRRKGIGFHALTLDETSRPHRLRTRCNRAAHNGERLPRAEAAELGATPCPRCYPDGQS